MLHPVSAIIARRPSFGPVLLAKSAERLTRPFATKRGARGGSIGRGRIKFYRFVGKKEESNADNVDSIACLQRARITIGFLYEREREREKGNWIRWKDSEDTGKRHKLGFPLVSDISHPKRWHFSPGGCQEERFPNSLEEHRMLVQQLFLFPSPRRFDKR